MQHLTLELSPQHTQHVSIACELVARLGIGQWAEAIHFWPTPLRYDHYTHTEALQPIVTDFMRQHPIHPVLAEDRLQEQQSGLPPAVIDGYQSSLSIAGAKAPLHARSAWDLYKVINHRLAWDRVIGQGLATPGQRNIHTMSMAFDPPLHLGPEPLPALRPMDGGQMDGGQLDDSLYQLECTPAQADLAREACALAARLGTGDLLAFADYLPQEHADNAHQLRRELGFPLQHLLQSTARLMNNPITIGQCQAGMHFQNLHDHLKQLILEQSRNTHTHTHRSIEK